MTDPSSKCCTNVTQQVLTSIITSVSLVDALKNPNDDVITTYGTSGGSNVSHIDDSLPRANPLCQGNIIQAKVRAKPPLRRECYSRQEEVNSHRNICCSGGTCHILQDLLRSAMTLTRAWCRISGSSPCLGIPLKADQGWT